MSTEDQGSDQLWAELEAINHLRLVERVAEVIAQGPENCQTYVAENLTIVRKQN